MLPKIILLVQTIIAFAFCFRFGYILTGYGHGGQLMGVPFAILMLLTTAYFLSQKLGIRRTMTFLFGTVCNSGSEQENENKQSRKMGLDRQISD